MDVCCAWVLKGTEEIFEVGERAVPPHEVQNQREEKTGCVEVGDPGSLQDEPETEDEEQDPEEMEDDDHISEEGPGMME